MDLTRGQKIGAIIFVSAILIWALAFLVQAVMAVAKFMS
jgi:hypothetical protein